MSNSPQNLKTSVFSLTSHINTNMKPKVIRQYLKSYQEFILELNHQMPGNHLGVNSPGYGQGAHVGNWGADFGNPSKGVRGHFGRKGDKTDPNLPQRGGSDYQFPEVVFNPITGQYLTKDDVKDLINQYNITSKQNSIEPLKFDKIDSTTIKFITKQINDMSNSF